MNKTIRFITAIFLIFTLSVLSHSAYAAPIGEISEGAVNIIVDGWEYDGRILVYKNSAYVSLREFATMADNSIVSWDAGIHTAYVETDTLELSAAEFGYYITANGRVLWCENGIFTLGGSIYVPLRQVAYAFGFDHDYVYAENTTYLTRYRAAVMSGDEF